LNDFYGKLHEYGRLFGVGARPVQENLGYAQRCTAWQYVNYRQATEQCICEYWFSQRCVEVGWLGVLSRLFLNEIDLFGRRYWEGEKCMTCDFI